MNGKALAVDSFEEFQQQVEELFHSGAYDELWQAAREQLPLVVIFAQLYGRPLSKETTKWKIKRLLSWAKGVGVIPRRRYKYI